MKLKYVAPLLALSMAIGTAYAEETVTVTTRVRHQML